mmetsp:Transcript_53248/g.122367  ORF Transcript_53248/g.122367 Transcript_53248/m.122367 type:complete len:637 (-) Transcript_53248:300-2210(-)
MCIGFGLAFALGHSWQASLAVSCTLAPTSMGIALNVLKAAKVLNTPTGQLIIAAAVLDDVVALVLLAMLQAIGRGTPAVSLLLPLCSSVLLMALAVVVARFVSPRVTAALLKRRALSKTRGRAEKALLGLLFCLALLLVPLCHALGTSHLLGTFLAGLALCSEPALHSGFTRQVKRALQWLLRLFFAATVGFEIPVREFANGRVVGSALLFSLAATGKLLTGVFAVPRTPTEMATVGFAMSAWGEFAFIIATAALDMHMINTQTFASLTLAVLISVLVSPLCLRAVLARAARASRARIRHAVDETDARRAAPPSAAAPQAVATTTRAADADAGVDGPSLGSAPVLYRMPKEVVMPVLYRMHALAAVAWGQSVRLLGAMGAQALTVLDFRTRQEGGKVEYELFLEDTRLSAPPRRDLPEEIEALMQKRLGELIQALTPLVSTAGGSAQCSIERWLPGTPDGSPPALREEQGPSGASADLMAARELALAQEPQEVGGEDGGGGARTMAGLFSRQALGGGHLRGRLSRSRSADWPRQEPAPAPSAARPIAETSDETELSNRSYKLSSSALTLEGYLSPRARSRRGEARARLVSPVRPEARSDGKEWLDRNAAGSPHGRGAAGVGPVGNVGLERAEESHV